MPESSKQQQSNDSPQIKLYDLLYDIDSPPMCESPHGVCQATMDDQQRKELILNVLDEVMAILDEDDDMFQIDHRNETGCGQ